MRGGISQFALTLAIAGGATGLATASYADPLTSLLSFASPLTEPGYELISQDQTAPLPIAEDEVLLDPIIITGEKQDRSILETFTSVGVVTGQELEDFNVRDIRGAFNRMANVRWNEANGANNGFTIRGVNSEGVVSPENNAPVASVIIDGASQSIESTRRGSRGIWDVQQVEVLRGPQSLLQGRAALAGAVVIETNDPTFTPEYGFQGTLGNQDRRDVAFFASGPLVPGQLAYRLSGEYREERVDIDYADDAFEELADDEYRNIRGKLLWTPLNVPGLDVLFTISDTFDKPADRTVTPEFEDREFDGDAINSELREGKNRNYIAEITYDIDDYLTFESVTAYVDAETDISTPSELADQYSRDETRTGNDFTQDFRLGFGDTVDTFSGVVGLFYGNFDFESDGDIAFGSFLVQDIKNQQTTEQVSAYADLRYRVTDQATALVGGRLLYERVKTDIEGEFFDFNTFQYAQISADDSENYTEFLPSVGVAYDITPTQSVALTARRGYRSGFVQVVQGEINEVDPEFVWTYELAYRQEAVDGRWLFAANAFYNDYDDQQITVVDDASDFLEPFTVNAGSSHSYGAEIEGRYSVGNGLSIFGSLGLLQTEFDDFDTGDGDFSGNEFPEAPQTTASLGVFYEHTSGFFASADASYTDSYFSTGDIENDDQLEVDSYTLANASVGYARGNFRLTAFVDNIFDEDYITGLSNPDFGQEPTLASIGDGRTFGVTLDARF